MKRGSIVRGGQLSGAFVLPSQNKGPLTVSDDQLGSKWENVEFSFPLIHIKLFLFLFPFP